MESLSEFGARELDIPSIWLGYIARLSSEEKIFFYFSIDLYLPSRRLEDVKNNVVLARPSKTFTIERIWMFKKNNNGTMAAPRLSLFLL
jgi:hypothetical protein